jgi:hypothetical protein
VKNSRSDLQSFGVSYSDDKIKISILLSRDRKAKCIMHVGPTTITAWSVNACLNP